MHYLLPITVRILFDGNRVRIMIIPLLTKDAHGYIVYMYTLFELNLRVSSFFMLHDQLSYSLLLTPEEVHFENMILMQFLSKLVLGESK